MKLGAQFNLFLTMVTTTIGPYRRERRERRYPRVTRLANKRSLLLFNKRLRQDGTVVLAKNRIRGLPVLGALTEVCESPTALAQEVCELC
jgi:hypothetical protein